MKENVTIGVLCLARTTFDYPAAAELFKGITADLKNIENANFEIIPDLVIEIADARKAADILIAKKIDALICISGTFHLGHLILEIKKIIRKPVLLWGLPELPYDGGKIRLNSVCGVNLNASNLYKAEIRDYHAHIGPRVDEAWIDAIRIIAALEKARVGIAGFRAHGFFNLGVYDLSVYRHFGVLIDHFELDEIFAYPASEKDIETAHKKLTAAFTVTGINEEQLRRVSSLSAKLDGFLKSKDLTALAIRCWPEFAGTYGISPCAAMSLLQSEGKILSCEGDVEGALSMIAHRAVGAETPFLFDFSQVDFEEDYALLWHCGVAPCNLWDGKSECSLDTYFAGGKGVTADFVLKTGEVSILRFDSTEKEYRVFLQKAVGIPMGKELKGTYLKVKFDRHVREVLETVINNGIAHHASMVYGDYIKPFDIFAKIKSWKVIK